MVDRKARDQIAAALQSYMEERTTAFEFDDALWEIVTPDKTAREIIGALWFFYDDTTDHTIVASKEDWDYFNRLQLLLQSDGELEYTTTGYCWKIRQCLALICLLLFCAVALKVGIGEQLLVAAIPFGFASMLLAFLGNREARKREKGELALAPFSSIASLLALRRGVPSFVRRRYPHYIQSRQIRSSFSRECMLIPYRIAWLIFSPIPLLFQALPEKMIETRISLPY